MTIRRVENGFLVVEDPIYGDSRGLERARVFETTERLAAFVGAWGIAAERGDNVPAKTPSDGRLISPAHKAQFHGYSGQRS